MGVLSLAHDFKTVLNVLIGISMFLSIIKM